MSRRTEARASCVTTPLPECRSPAPGKPGAEFVSPDAGGLSHAVGIELWPGWRLSTRSAGTYDAILRYDGITGAPWVRSWPPVGGLDARVPVVPQDGYLYVTSAGRTRSCGLTLYTGDPAGISGDPGDAVFIASGSGGLDNPSAFVSHDGDFFV